jgi:hypothetical protein
LRSRERKFRPVVHSVGIGATAAIPLRVVIIEKAPAFPQGLLLSLFQ